MSVGEADLEVGILALGGLEISVRRRSRPRAAADPEADEGFVLVEPEAIREPQDARLLEHLAAPHLP